MEPILRTCEAVLTPVEFEMLMEWHRSEVSKLIEEIEQLPSLPMDSTKWIDIDRIIQLRAKWLGKEINAPSN